MVWVTDYEKVRQGEEKLWNLKNPAKAEIIFENASQAYINSAWDRFLKKCRLNSATGCVEWIGSKDANGYGKFMFLGKPILAHRMALMFTDEFKKALDPDFDQSTNQFSFRAYLAAKNSSGKKPPKIMIAHTCGNRSCVSTAHLEIRQTKAKK